MNDARYHAVRNRLQLQQALPVTPDWSAAPDFLQRIIDHCLGHKPSIVLECGSGLTTLVLARCCQMHNHGQVYSLENGPAFAAATRAVLAAFGLEQHATVVDAPLEAVSLQGAGYNWYGRRTLPAGSIDMLVIDGPPGFLQRHSRYPALPLLHGQLAADATVFLDDAARGDEQEIVAMWLDAFPCFEHQYLALERGCSILQRDGRRLQPGA